MKFLILLSALAFASVASAQDCQNGRCNAQQPARVIRTQTVYEYPKQQQPTRYTVQLEPVPVTTYHVAQPTFSVPVYSAPVYYAPAPTYYRVEQPRRYRVVYVIR
jgi:hypothetical protein